MVELLAEAAPGLFEIVTELDPREGEHVWAYGSDETLASLQQTLPRGVVLHAHGSGFAVAVVESTAFPGAPERAALMDALAMDIVLFEQRGCLSPRVLLVAGGSAEPFARALAESLKALERRILPGILHPEERAAITNYRTSMTMAGDVLEAGNGYVTFSEAGPVVVAPVGRNLHVLGVSDSVRALTEFEKYLTAVAVAGSDVLRANLAEAFPACRLTEFGKLQRPPFDGPVDRRAPPEGKTL
jgi:hypothetical protein